MQFKHILAASTGGIALAMGLAAPAMAQSTGSIDFEEREIIVTGTRGPQNVGGIAAPDTSKAKAVLTQENIQRQNPGQTILDTINQVPGVSFQNNDAYGSSGGTLSIRGFSSDRISLTFDGIPLNDSGNYAIYSNQQIDPELIEQVNVNLGTTDVDSPTASAVGGTVNYRTKNPDRDFGVMLSGSAGQFDFMRMFAKVETGDLTEGGLRAWVSMSRATNDNPFNNYGKVNKQQYNAKIYQPLGGDDFISIAGHYNQNRNNFFGSLPLRLDANRVVGSGSGNRFPANADERRYNIAFPCFTDTPQSTVADVTNSCGTQFDRRYNPSNTGNVRINSRFTLSDSLVLTIDPSFQYVKANGGGTVTGREGTRTVAGTAYTGFFQSVSSSNGYYFGRDLNGDNDTLDQVTLLAPSQTQTKRYGVIAGLRWDMNENNTLRLAYTWDSARHRQTGQVGKLLETGEPVDVFPVNDGLQTSQGFTMQKRDRLSYAILHQVAAEYKGEFADNKLVLNAGVRVPFFRRNLTNNCFTSSAGGNLECLGSDAAQITAYAAANPTYGKPQQRVYNYSKVLPNVGVVYYIDDNLSAFASFSQGLSVPGTDSLYNAMFFAPGNARAKPAPETTDNFDLGWRYRSGKVQAQLSVFYNQFHNRLATAYDAELDQNVYRNLGNVKKYGVDGSVAFAPIPEIALYAFGSVIRSEIRDNIAIGENPDGTPIFAATAGQRESGMPRYTFGGTIRGTLGPVDIGLTAKRTGERYIYDTNQPTFQGYFVPVGSKNASGVTPSLTATQAAANGRIYDNAAPAYWLVNLDARLKLGFIGLNDDTFIQLNVYNLFDQYYVGGFGGGLNQSSTLCTAANNAANSSVTACRNAPVGTAAYGGPNFVQIGAPRTVSASVVFKF